MSEPARPAPVLETGRGRLFWSSAAVGWGIVAFGVWTIVQHARATDPANFALLFVGLAVLHDLVVAPALSLVGSVLGPRLAGRTSTIVVIAGVVSGALVLVALPPLLGDPADNPTILPRNYLAGLIGALALVWSVALVAMLRARRR